MSQHNRFYRTGRAVAKGAMAATVLLTMTACLQTTPDTSVQEAIDYRQARFDSLASIRSFETCHEEGVGFAQQARSNKSIGQYLTAARLLQSCETELGNAAIDVDQEMRMRNYALSIQNYVKGGDIATAQNSLEKFKTAFLGNDLYYPDGTSFIAAMDSLLAQVTDNAFGQFSMLNISQDFKHEMRRKNHWVQK